MDAYSSAIRLCASTPLELRNFGSTDLPLGQTRSSVLCSRANYEDFSNSRMMLLFSGIWSVISTQTFARRYWNENKPTELAPQWQSEWCGEGKLRTPKYENRKSCFFLCLEFRFSDQNGGIQPEKVTRKIAGKKVCIINHLYFLAERGGFEPPVQVLARTRV
jgi:hypothetical protein